MLDIKESLFVLVSYGLGCFNTGYYLIRFRMRQDIRDLGSGNAGATNAGRVLGTKGFILALFGDFFKGMLVMWLAMVFNLSIVGTLLALSAVIIGHNWPVQLRFRGGKGIATAFGAMSIFDPMLTLVLAGLFSLGWLITRKFITIGLLVIALSPLIAIILQRPLTTIMAIIIVVAIILIAHIKEFYQAIKRYFSRQDFSV